MADACCLTCGCAVKITASQLNAGQCDACSHVHATAPNQRDVWAQASVVPPVLLGASGRARAYVLEREAEFARFTTEVIAQRSLLLINSNAESASATGSTSEAVNEGKSEAGPRKTLEIEPQNSFNRMLCYALSERYGLSRKSETVREKYIEKIEICGCCQSTLKVPVKRITFWFETYADAMLPVFSVADHWAAKRARIDLSEHGFGSFAGYDMKVDEAAAAARRKAANSGTAAAATVALDATATATASLQSTERDVKLSLDVLDLIFSFLPPRAVLVSCAKVCRSWREASRSDVLWLRIARIFEVEVDTVSASGYSSVRQWFLDKAANNHRIQGASAFPLNAAKRRRALRNCLLREALAEVGCPPWRLRYIENCDYVRKEDLESNVLQARSRLLKLIPPESEPSTDPFDATKGLNSEVVSVRVQLSQGNEYVRCQVPICLSGYELREHFRLRLGLDKKPSGVSRAVLVQDAKELKPNDLVFLDV